MDIVHLAAMGSPLLGAAAGYLVDGLTGATSGFLIPLGPAVVAWLLGGVTRSSKPSHQAR